jgi:hypothetical protein
VILRKTVKYSSQRIRQHERRDHGFCVALNVLQWLRITCNCGIGCLRSLPFVCCFVLTSDTDPKHKHVCFIAKGVTINIIRIFCVTSKPVRIINLGTT